MLARATAREREIAVRLAIGASRRRIVRQMLSESLLIAGCGALGGALLAQWLSRALVAFLSTDSTRLFVDLSPDWRLFAFIAALAVLACLLFGLTPALKATGANPGRTMQAGGRSTTDSHERFAIRRALVVVQVALSLVLIVGAAALRTQPAQPHHARSGIPAGRPSRRKRRRPSITGPRGRAPAAVRAGDGACACRAWCAVRGRGLHRADERLGMEQQHRDRRREAGRHRQLQSRRRRLLPGDGNAAA